MDNENKPKAGEVVKRLIAEDGWKGLYRGLGLFQLISLGYLNDSMLRVSEYVSPSLVKYILILLVPK